MPDSLANPQYDFIMQDQKQPAKKFSLPGLNGRPPRSLLLIGSVILLLILLFVLLFGGKGPKNDLVIDAVAQSQEIQRVSALVQQRSKDQPTADFASTVVTVEASQQQQLAAYLAKHGSKIVPSKLTAHKDTSADNNVQLAVQNGNITSFYVSYLKAKLGTYQTSLQTAYDKTTSSQLKTLLNSAYLSNQAILKSPGF